MRICRRRRSTRMCSRRGCARRTTDFIRGSRAAAQTGTYRLALRLLKGHSLSRRIEAMERTFWQKLEGTTEQVLTQLKKLVEEGNIRRVVVKQKGRTVAEFPLTAGVIGGVIAPVAAAIGALTALVTGCSIEVEKIVTEPESTPVP